MDDQTSLNIFGLKLRVLSSAKDRRVFFAFGLAFLVFFIAQQIATYRYLNGRCARDVETYLIGSYLNTQLPTKNASQMSAAELANIAAVSDDSVKISVTKIKRVWGWLGGRHVFRVFFLVNGKEPPGGISPKTFYAEFDWFFGWRIYPYWAGSLSRD